MLSLKYRYWLGLEVTGPSWEPQHPAELLRGDVKPSSQLNKCLCKSLKRYLGQLECASGRFLWHPGAPILSGGTFSLWQTKSGLELLPCFWITAIQREVTADSCQRLLLFTFTLFSICQWGKNQQRVEVEGGGGSIDAVTFTRFRCLSLSPSRGTKARGGSVLLLMPWEE